MKKIAVLALLLLVSPMAVMTARAGVNRWTPFGRGDDSVLDLLQGPEGLYAVTSDSRLFRSTDGGSAWQFWGLGLDPDTKRVAADPIDPQRMVAVGIRGDMHRSLNAGRSWSRLPRVVDEENDPAIGSVATVAGTIYVGGRRLYLSRDGGGTWIDTTPIQAYVAVIAVDPADPRTIWFGTTDGLWKTADGGETFTLAVNPSYEIGNRGITALAVAPSRPSTVYAGANRRTYASTDGGATWQPGGSIGTWIGIGDVVALAVDPSTPATVYAGGPGGIARSLDGGATWTILVERLATSSLVFGPSGTLLAGTYGAGLQGSRDGGRSWSRQDRVGMGYPTTWLIERGPRRAPFLYLFHSTLGPNLLRSQDDGRTWTAFGDFSGYQTTLFDLAFDKRRPGILYGVSFHQAFRIGPDGKVKRMAVPSPRDMYTVATAGRAIVVGGAWAGYRSADGGETWTTVLPHTVRKGRTPGEEDTFRVVLQLVEDPQDPGVLYALTIEYTDSGLRRNVALRSDDTGLHWRPIRSAPALFAVAADPSNAGTLYSVESEESAIFLLRNRDGGEHWRRIGTIVPGGVVLSLIVDTKNPDVLWAAADTGVLRSEDGGRTWAPFNTGLARPGLGNSAVRLTPDPAVPGRLYTMPHAGGLFELTTN